MYRDTNGKFISTEEYNKQRNKKDESKMQHEVAATEANEKATTASHGYSYFSRLLNKPFDTLEELTAAENTHRKELATKEDLKARRKHDAELVGEAYKAMNTARREYKEKLAQLTTEYAEALENLRKAFELGKKDVQNKLAEAEEAYQTALKEFTSKYESYHLTLKDGDFETTISSQVSGNLPRIGIDLEKFSDIFDLMFNF